MYLSEMNMNDLRPSLCFRFCLALVLVVCSQNAILCVASPPQLDAFWDRSYYTTETRARLHVATDFAGELSIRVAVTGAAKPYEQRLSVHVGENSLDVNPASFAIGNHATTVTALSGGKSRCETVLTKLAPLARGSEVKIDRYNRCVLVDGQPFFPVAPVLCRRNLNGVRQEGFNTVVRWGWGFHEGTGSPGDRGAAAKADTLLPAAEADGLKVIEFLEMTRPYAQFTALKSTGQFSAAADDWLAKDLPGTLDVIREKRSHLASIVLDEPDGDLGLSIARRAIAVARQHDPYHPSFINWAHFIQPPRNLNTADESLIQPYIYWQPDTMRGRTIRDFVRSAAEHARASHKPFWVMPMSEQSAVRTPCPLTPAEQFANTYIMLVHGATGLSYFNWPAAHRTSSECLRDLNGEVRILAPALLRRPPLQAVSHAPVENQPPAIDLALRTMPDGSPILILVNLDDSPVNFACRLPWLSPGCTLEPLVKRPGKGATLAGKRFVETLEPLATRAYHIKGHRISENGKTHLMDVSETRPSGGGAIELIRNGGFEDDSWWILPRETNVAFDSIIAAAGKRSLRVRRGSAAEPQITVNSPTLQLRANRCYRLTCSWRVDGSGKPPDTKDRGLTIMLKQVSGPKQGWLPIYRCRNEDDRWHADHAVWNLALFDNIEVNVAIAFYNEAGEFHVDKVSLLDLGPIPHAGERNLVSNSSFEVTRLKSWPDGWRPTTTYDPWSQGVFFGDSGAPFSHDTNQPFHGTACLRIDKPERQPTWYSGRSVSGVSTAPYNFYDSGIRTIPGAPYVCSFYLRSDPDGLPVKATVRGVAQGTFTLGKEWRRFELAGNAGGTFTGIQFEVADGQAGTFWIDAVQLEPRRTATPYIADEYKSPGQNLPSR